MLTNALSRIVGEILGKTAFARKAEGVVSVDFEPVVAVEVPDPKTVKLLFNQSTCTTIGLDPKAVQAKFDAGAKKKPVTWTASS